MFQRMRDILRRGLPPSAMTLPASGPCLVVSAGNPTLPFISRQLEVGELQKLAEIFLTPETEAVWEHGEAADALLADRQFRLAIHRYIGLEATIEAMSKSSGTVDLNNVGKCVLGLLIAYVSIGELTKAHTLWRTEGKLPAMGVLALDSATLGPRDLILYRIVSAELWSHAADEHRAKSQVDLIFQTLAKSVRDAVPALQGLVASKWFACLSNIGRQYAETRVPHIARRLPGIDANEIRRPRWYPRPEPWRPPDDRQFIVFRASGRRPIAVTYGELQSSKRSSGKR